jgi:hypothetical protein
MARQAKSAEKQTLRPTFHHASKHSSGCRRWVARSYSRRAVLARGVGDSERFFCSENTVSMENGDSAFIGVAFDRCNVSVRYGYRDMSLRDVTEVVRPLSLCLVSLVGNTHRMYTGCRRTPVG